jgi:hypothetical protein
MKKIHSVARIGRTQYVTFSGYFYMVSNCNTQDFILCDIINTSTGIAEAKYTFPCSINPLKTEGILRKFQKVT